MLAFTYTCTLSFSRLFLLLLLNTRTCITQQKFCSLIVPVFLFFFFANSPLCVRQTMAKMNYERDVGLRKHFSSRFSQTARMVSAIAILQFRKYICGICMLPLIMYTSYQDIYMYVFCNHIVIWRLVFLFIYV